MFSAISLIKTPSRALLFKQLHKFGLIKFNLPDLGEKIKEGTIKKLYVSEGDTVEQFQKLADVASDKQFTEITASDAGVITKIHYSEEDVCQVGDLFLEINTPDSSSSASQDAVKPKEKKGQKSQQILQPSQSQKSTNGSSVQATPFVRGLIKKHGLDISNIVGSGPQGRITEKDVTQIVSSKSKRTPSIQFGRKDSSKQSVDSASPTPSSSASSRTVKMSLFERGMQKSMTVANSIPHLYLHEEIDLTECEKLRQSLKASQLKVTVMGLLIKTFSLALKNHPRVNSTYNPETSQFEFLQHRSHNISVAIDSPNGLVVPNIKDVQTLSLLKIQQQLERLRTLSLEAKLTATDLQNGTVCLSNIGTIGGIMANPLILAPQVCIVAIGKLQVVSKYINGQFVPRKVINVSFGCDHRIIDGASVARFSNEWKGLLENPYIAIAQMV